MILREFEIEIEPIAKGRPRFSTRGGFARTYTPAKTRNYEAELVDLIKPYCPLIPFKQALKLTCEFHLKGPKKKVREYPDVKPDTDNFLKCLLDAMNPNEKLNFQGMWEDDSQVIHVDAKKLYAAQKPMIKIKIEAV